MKTKPKEKGKGKQFLRKLAMWERQSKMGHEEGMKNLSAFEAMCEMPKQFTIEKFEDHMRVGYVKKQLEYLESCGLVFINRDGKYEKTEL